MLKASRPRNTGLIAFGSNQGDSLKVFKASIAALKQIAGVTVVAHSQPVVTDSVTGSLAGETGNPDDDQPYLNAVIRIETCLSPSELHLQTAAIEHQFGRVRTGRWQPRVIDLDLLLLGELIVGTRSLTLPHPRMSFRRFVLEPAAEIAPELIHPLANCSIATLLERINSPDKIMALVCPKSAIESEGVEGLIGELSKVDSNWRFKKLFSAEKLFQLDSNLTVVVVFDSPFDGPQTKDEIEWSKLRAAASHFAGPSLCLNLLPSDPLALTELTAVLQTIG